MDLDDALGEATVGRYALAVRLLVTTPAEKSGALDPHHPAQPADSDLAALVDQLCSRVDREIEP